MIVKLNKKQFDYLNDSLIKMQESLKLKLYIVDKAQYILIETNEETADEIRDWANEELQKKGFNIDYDLTNEGKILESLIDSFYVE